MVNARVETASTKPTFKESWERHRCVVPASYYFEWEHLINAATGKAKTGDKYMIQPKGSAVTWLAGLYRIEDISGIQIPVCTVLTREPSEEIRFIHDRMPVILPGDDIEKWINPDSKPDEIIKNAMTDMVFEKIIAQQSKLYSRRNAGAVALSSDHSPAVFMSPIFTKIGYR